MGATASMIRIMDAVAPASCDGERHMPLCWLGSRRTRAIAVRPQIMVRWHRGVGPHAHGVQTDAMPFITVPVVLPVTSNPICRRGGNPSAGQKQEKALPRAVALPPL